MGIRGPDRENSYKYLSYGEKNVKIGPIDAEIFSVNFLKRRNCGR